MAYNKEELERKSVEAIQKHRLFFVTDVPPMIGMSTSTFYFHKLHENENINKALKVNRSENLLNQKAYKVECKRKYLGTGYVYIVQCGDFNYYKIGISKKNFQNRLSGLQVGSPFPLKMLEVYHCPNYSQLERELHLKYFKHRMVGEWFELTDEQIQEVKDHLEKRVTEQITLF